MMTTKVFPRGDILQKKKLFCFETADSGVQKVGALEKC